MTVNFSLLISSLAQLLRLSKLPWFPRTWFILYIQHTGIFPDSQRALLFFFCIGLSLQRIINKKPARRESQTRADCVGITMATEVGFLVSVLVFGLGLNFPRVFRLSLAQACQKKERIAYGNATLLTPRVVGLSLFHSLSENLLLSANDSALRLR